MLKLIVLSALVACTIAGVAPKLPATQGEQKESPSVKGVPLHPDHHSVAESHKPGEVKHEVKHVEANKPHEKTAKKDEHHQAPLKKADQHGHHEAASHDSHVKVGHEHQPTPAVKDVHKGHKVEEGKAKSHEHGH